MVDRGGEKDHRRTDHHQPAPMRSDKVGLAASKTPNDPAPILPPNAQAMWLFTKQELLDSPSHAEGISVQQEVSYRRTMCGFMQDAGIKLKLPQPTIATAIVFFHRYFAVNSFKSCDRYITAAACLFLAGKVEETPKKLRDVILVTDACRHKGQQREPVKADSAEFLVLREEVLMGERNVLQTMAFDLTVKHPYEHLITYVKTLRGNQSNESFKTLAQVSWNFVNDSLRTTLCLQYRPQVVACATIYLASRCLRAPLPDATVSGVKRPWWEALEVRATHEDLDDISAQILDLYEQSPTLAAIRSGSDSSVAMNPASLTLSSASVAPDDGVGRSAASTSSGMISSSTGSSTDAAATSTTPAKPPASDAKAAATPSDKATSSSTATTSSATAAVTSPTARTGTAEPSAGHDSSRDRVAESVGANGKTRKENRVDNRFRPY